MNYIRNCSFEQLESMIDFLTDTIKLHAQREARGWRVDCINCRKKLALQLMREEEKVRVCVSSDCDCSFPFLLQGFKDYQLLNADQKILPVPAHELLCTVYPPQELLLGDWLPKNTSVLIAGESGTGKSYFTATLVWAIASGGSCFNWQSPKRAKVGIFDGELRDSKIQERLKIIASCVQKDTAEITIVSRDKYTVENLPFPDLADTKQARSVLEMFSGVDILVVDNVNCCFTGRDENSSGFWQSVQEFTLLCRERDITLILVHHCPKSNPNQPAGNSKNERIFEKVIVLSKILPPAKLSGAHFNVHFYKDRDCSEDTKDFSTRLVRGTDGVHRWEVKDFINQKVDEGRYSGALLENIQALRDTGLTFREIESKTGISRSKVQRILSKVSHVSAGQAETLETDETDEKL